MLVLLLICVVLIAVRGSNGDISPPTIADSAATQITPTSVTIVWSTNEPATTQVEFGASAAYGSGSDTDTRLAVYHNVTLSNLSPSTTYHFVIKSSDGRGNEATSEDSTFTTLASTAAVNQTTGQITVHFIDVGQGDAILIDASTYEVLIDAGESSPGVVSEIGRYVDGPLEVMVATHPHADHIGGLSSLLGAFQVQQIWIDGETSTSQTYATFMTVVQAEGADVREARRGDQISVDDLTFKVLDPTVLSGTTNNNSIVLTLRYGRVDFLFEGDAEQEAEASMVAAGLIPDVDILKVGHHGSRTASSPAFLATAKPEVAIYMAGTGNSYGHPHAETIAALHAVGATIYGTDVNGDITVTTDGQTYSVTTER